MLSRSLIILTVVGFSCAATFQGYLPSKPKEHAHKEGCYLKELDDVVPFGTEVTPIGAGSCYRINCEINMIYYASCGLVDTEDRTCYKTEEDPSLPYPSCCSTIKCEEDNKI